MREGQRPHARLPPGLKLARLLSRCVRSENEHTGQFLLECGFVVQMLVMELKSTLICFAFSPLIQSSAGWVAKEKRL